MSPIIYMVACRVLMGNDGEANNETTSAKWQIRNKQVYATVTE
jgi:hypothetical protein